MLPVDFTVSQVNHTVVLGGVVVIVLAIGPNVRGLKPGREGGF
jgi:hypothetical protein